jgi:hypothetical protein
MKKDVTKMMAGAERLMEKTTNPRHLAILRNYRRHAMLEVSGRFDEIFDPSMTIETPQYVSYTPNGCQILDGVEDVMRVFYGQFMEHGASVMILENEAIAVDDWGLASEYISNDYINATVARLRGFDVDDDNATYLHRHRVIMTWRYSDDCRLIGENVSMEMGGTIEKLAPEDVVTVAEAHEKLGPLIGPNPPRFDRNGMPLEQVAA